MEVTAVMIDWQEEFEEPKDMEGLAVMIIMQEEVEGPTKTIYGPTIMIEGPAELIYSSLSTSFLP